MSSLSITAGSISPKSFQHGGHDSATYLAKVTKLSDMSVTWTSPLVRYESYTKDIYFGKLIKDFHKRKNQGELLPYTQYLWLRAQFTPATTPYYTQSGSYRYERLYPVEGGNVYHVHPAPYTVGEINLLDSCITNNGIDPVSYVQRAASKIYSRGWDTLTFLAEFHKTVQMFRRAIPNLLNLLEALAGDPRVARNWSKPFGAWLEARYGWRILKYDIEDITNAIKHFDDDELTRVKDRVGVGVDDSTNTVWSQTGGYGEFRADVLVREELSVRGSIIADFMPNRFRTNVATTAWELTTLSFVVDWFISVGKALDAISFLIGNSQYTAAVGEWYKYTLDISNTAFIPATGWSGLYDQPSKFELEIRRRTPKYVPYIPTVSINLNAFKVADLVALVGQAVTRFLAGKRIGITFKGGAYTE